MNLTRLVYIEECPNCDTLWDVAHDKEVEYEWVYRDDDGFDDDQCEDDEDNLITIDDCCPYCGAVWGMDELDREQCAECGWVVGTLYEGDEGDE